MREWIIIIKTKDRYRKTSSWRRCKGNTVSLQIDGGEQLTFNTISVLAYQRNKK